MKKSLLISALAAFTFLSCNNTKSEKDHAHDAEGNHVEAAGTHTHDDGSVHQDHEADTTVKQEQFKVEQDSTAHGHDHSDPNHKH